MIVFIFSDEDPRREPLAAELQVQEIALKESIEKLKLVEATRAALVAQLKEAIWEQVCWEFESQFMKLMYANDSNQKKVIHICFSL